MKKQNLLLPFLVFLTIMLSGQVISQAPNGLPLYQNGKLYLQLKSNSNIAIHGKDTVLNDVAEIFKRCLQNIRLKRQNSLTLL